MGFLVVFSGAFIVGAVLTLIYHHSLRFNEWLVKRYNPEVYAKYRQLITARPLPRRILAFDDFRVIKRRGKFNLLFREPGNAVYYCFGFLWIGTTVLDRYDNEVLFCHACKVLLGGVPDPINVEPRDHVNMRGPHGRRWMERAGVGFLDHIKE